MFIGVMLAMGVALGLSIVFNRVIINVLERRREFAVMRAVGLSRSRRSLILTRENPATGFLGIAMWVPVGRQAANYFMSLFETDLFNLGAINFPRTSYAAATSSVLSFRTFPYTLPGNTAAR